MATTRHRSLVGRGRRKAFVRDKDLEYTQTRKGKKCQETQSKKQIRVHTASSKTTRLEGLPAPTSGM